ncbi:MAG: isoleucine--tRNA ligase [Candidatus Woesearchaeota archaeon]
MEDTIRIEENIIRFWNDNDIISKARKKNKNAKPYYYLDGPPYTSGRIHIGHAWGKALRDMVMRYKRMRGYDVFDRAGFDMHGLPTSHKVQQKHNLESPGDIASFGYDRFTEECKSLALDNMKQMIEDFRRLGVWMDFDNPYMPINNDYIEGVWWLIKKAYDKGRLYEGYRTLHWDPKDETALSKHELEYQSMVDESIFVMFPLKEEDDTYLVAWTTTPWTIPYNLAIMVNPKVEYSYCRIKDKILIIASECADNVLSKAGIEDYDIIKTVKGADMEGLRYSHPLSDHIPQFNAMAVESPNIHSVVCSTEHVDTTTGSGLVHCAPGCGPEDYEVGYRYGINPFNTIDTKGIVRDLGIMSGLAAKKEDKKFVKIIEDHNALLHKEPYKHDYPFAERSKQPVVFRVTKQWFLRIEDIKDKMKELNSNVHWVPEWAGKHQFHNWIDNLRDNSITKQIHWGTPLPIWRSDDNDIIVIGSISELVEYATGPLPESLHKPYIDDIILVKNNKEYRRIPDVLDVWVDAGAASWLALDYPKRKDLFERYYPADFIVEGKDQIRGWFNLLLVCSIIGFDNISFKSCYMHGFINDSQGRKMSKSLGNIISPDEVIVKYGADISRVYMIGAASAGEDMNYNFDDIDVRMKNFNVLFNMASFIKTLSEGMKLPLKPITNIEGLDPLSKAMISRLHDTIRKVTTLYDDYRLDEIPWIIESLYLDLSRVYLQFMREDISDNTDNVSVIARVLGDCLRNIMLMLAPIAPHLTEHLYQELKDCFGDKEESVHLLSFPKNDNDMIMRELLDSFRIMQDIRSAMLSARDKAGIGVRWPLRKATIVSDDTSVNTALEVYGSELERQLNIKNISVKRQIDDSVLSIDPDLGLIGRTFKAKSSKALEAIRGLSQDDLRRLIDKGSLSKEDMTITSDMARVSYSIPPGWHSAPFKEGQALVYSVIDEELEKEGHARETARAIQDARKAIGLGKADKAVVHIDTRLLGIIGDEWKAWISKRTGSTITPLDSELNSIILTIKDTKYSISVSKE